MPSIEFLTLEDVLAIHLDQVTRYGGDASIRDLGLLQSAIVQPESTFGEAHLHAFPFEMAAAYLFHLVMNHPFADGNKRTGTVAALVFLDWHGIEIEANEGELADLTLCVTLGQLTKQDIARWLEEHQVKPSP